MTGKRRIVVLGHTVSLFLAISYLLCVSLGLLLPKYQMYEAWAPLLPGFEWLTLTGFIFGLVGSYAYGWLIAVLWVPINEFFERRTQ